MHTRRREGSSLDLPSQFAASVLPSEAPFPRRNQGSHGSTHLSSTGSKAHTSSRSRLRKAGNEVKGKSEPKAYLSKPMAAAESTLFPSLESVCVSRNEGAVGPYLKNEVVG